MAKYQQFIFKRWAFEAEKKTLTCTYSYDDELEFNETFTFDFEIVDFNVAAFKRAADNLFFIAGVSYYKAFLAPTIKVEFGAIDQAHAAFYSKTYQKGLGEFFYINKLDPLTTVNFPINSDPITPVTANSTGLLVGLGGGKDSLVSIELLQDQDITTWSLGHKQQLQPLAEAVGRNHLWVERAWDPQIQALNAKGAYNGHVPISAIFAAVGTITAILSGKRDVVVSNERSADEPTLEYNGVSINHQYSKSSEFEKDYQAILAAGFGESQRYYSLLRPLSELRIAELFAKTGFEKYKGVFSSCNRAFTKASNQIFWCGECPKCAFVFLILTPFVERSSLEALFGKNLLLEPALTPTYEQLLGIAGEKPLECVGEILESRTAMEMAKQHYPELAVYSYELPDQYNYASLEAHLVPANIYESIETSLTA